MTNIPDHIKKAIAQAKKDGNKGVCAWVGGWDKNTEINRLLNEGKLESYLQEYTDVFGDKSICMLLRKPNNTISNKPNFYNGN